MNNTLTEAEKSKDKTTETAKGKEAEKDISRTKDRGEENTTTTAYETTTAVSREEKYTQATVESYTEKSSGGSRDKDSEDSDNSLDTVEKSVEKDLDQEKTDNTEVVRKDKGQEEKEKKEEQVNGKRDPGKVGPNDTKLTTATSEDHNAVEASEADVTKNNTLRYNTKDKMKENNTISSPENKRTNIPGRVNVTQFTRYRAGGDDRTAAKEHKTDEEAEQLEKRKENEKEKEINQSFSGRRFSKHVKVHKIPL